MCSSDLMTVDHQVYAWGNAGGALGTLAQVVTLATDNPDVRPVKVEAGDSYTLTLMDDGSVYSWTTIANAATALPVQNGQAPSREGGTVYMAGMMTLSAGSGSNLVLSADGYLYAWGSNAYGELGVGATGDVASADANSATRPTLVGGRAADLMQITTAEVTAAHSTAPGVSAGADPTATATLAYGQDIIGANKTDLQSSINSAILNNPANDTRGRKVYYAPTENAGHTDIYGGELPVQVDITASQVLTINADAIITEQYKGYNLYWDVTTEKANPANLHWYTSDPGIVTVEQNGTDVVVTPTGNRSGRAVIYVIDDSNGDWGSLAVNVYYEGVNTDTAPIVSNAKVLSGDGYTFAIQWDGTVWAWGENQRNYLGISTVGSSSTPVGSFTWKYYSHADLEAFVAGTPTDYQTKLLELSTANNNGGAMVITGLTNLGQRSEEHTSELQSH